MDGWQPQGWRLREGLMHGIELFLKGRDRIPIGNTFWKVPMLRGSSVLLPLIPCLPLCSLPCSSSRVGRSGPFFLFIQFQWVRRKARVVCITGNLSEFVIIDQGTGFLHRSTVMEQSQQFLTMRKRLEHP